MIMSGSLLSKQVLAAHRIVEATGKVELKRQNSSYRPVSEGTELLPGDLLKPASGVRVKVLCEDGNTRSVPAGITTGINALCPPQRTRNGSRPIVRPRPVDRYMPYIISPRATSLLTDKPILRWNDATDASRFMVTVRGRGLDWTEKFSREQVCQDGICKVVYPGSQPLQPGVSYKLEVKADTNRASTEDSTGGLGFKLIDSDKAKEIQVIARRIQEQDVPDQFKGLALAELYAKSDLTAEAIEILEGLENDQKIAESYRLLGDLYRRIGLVLEAEVPYLQAVELAKATDNLKEMAAAKAGLGEVQYARGNRQEGVSLLEEAKAIYQKFGDRKRVEELEKRLAELK
ncbi:tetratricopeptide repeat protein [Moorena sp. SIO3I8]|uniref:tetratricopeptide repeat protein n=1 Tax=Moorena sp. SIO3I8 TaxID=2607833 RepID=UPI0013BFA7C1|nr:tetratricopeptide repeat protein [Moorena sp. SIO3I8]NEO06887.1 tetratricopeptide repeat protein [Moorena sp. SIO3I8]